MIWICLRRLGGCIKGEKGYFNRSPERVHTPYSDPLALSGKRSGTKLSGALKGATLLKLASLSTDAFQWSS